MKRNDDITHTTHTPPKTMTTATTNAQQTKHDADKEKDDDEAQLSEKNEKKNDIY